MTVQLHPGGRIASKVSQGGAAAVIAMGVAVLAGWAFDIQRLMTVMPGSIRMKPNTAVALMAAAFALLLEARNGRVWLRRVMAGLPLLLGAATLFEYFSHLSIGIDQLLFHDPIQQVYPGRMAHLTALNLITISLAILWTGMQPRRTAMAHALALACGLSSLFAIVGYLYGVPILYGSIRYTSMAFHTGISFLILALATLFIHPDRGLARRFWSLTSGGEVSRKLLPWAIVVPIALGACFVLPQMNFGELRLGLALSAMTSVITIATLVAKLSRSLEQFERARIEAEQDSTTDHLTRAHNRRYFDQRLAEEMKRSARSGAPLSLVLLDVDHFKAVNDRHGHTVGDSVLQWVASVATGTLRNPANFCRYGGEEFAIIVTDGTLHQAAAAAERVRSAIARAPWGEDRLNIAVSAGVAQVRENDTLESLVFRADEALYLAKRNGRNRVESIANGPFELAPMLQAS
jgi:diguanylate cyclase (GGDEF)-like protein